MFIHFGSYSYLGEGENAVYVDDWVFDRFAEYQSEVSAKFNPTGFNAGTIAELAKNAGMKYLVITAKHCEGFCMWKTNVQSFTDLTGTKLYSLPDFTEFKDRDILKELKDSCEVRGIKFGLYYSILDWNHKSQIPHSNWYTNMVSFAARAEYIKDMKAQLKELITNYQPAVIWFDGDWTFNDGAPTLSRWWTTTDAKDLYNYLMNLDPTLIVNERIIRGFGLGDFETAEGNVPARPLFRQWETCRNMNGSWGYNWKKMNTYKTPMYLIREMVKVVA
jgi:alpha-L-fucosidase